MAAIEAGSFPVPKAVPSATDFSLFARRHSGRSVIVIALLAGLLSVLVHWAWLTHLPPHWDSVQYSLAVVHYDLATHQPHPPGYFLYVSLARLLHLAGLSPYQSLLALSVIAVALMTVLLTYWAGLIGGRPTAAATAVVVLASPLVWRYATQGDTYALSGLLSACVGYLCWREMQNRSDFPVSALALAAAAGVRPTDGLFLLPLWVACQWRRGPANVVTGLAAMALGSIVWLFPLIASTGGLARYLELTARQSEFVRDRAPLFGQLQWAGKTAAAVLIGLLGLLGFCWALLALRPRQVWRDCRYPLLLWAAPALLFYLFVHIGNLGYLMLVAPAFLLLAGLVSGQAMRRNMAAVAVLLAVMWWNNHHLLTRPVLTDRGQRENILVHARQACSPWLGEDCLVLAPARRPGPSPDKIAMNFRMAMYVLPEAHVVYFPPERVVRFGYHPNYSRLWHSRLMMDSYCLPGIRHLLLLHQRLLQYLPRTARPEPIFQEGDLTIYRVALPDGSSVCIGPGDELRVHASSPESLPATAN